ncbi:FtsW/RodA/SpoVE family cell cycle protein [Magnetospira sp. QH-2]|uniref:FtsW/RodA/SpoVE family cell cycle protein n=1 Tax=Magnetospira sp. (strain QH-2) TaxID=1288970 RepID=UPI0003E80A69|nr:putative peptidoglycan glycosyltransferase FtsW [Magnetospira sp. QH-2]CCQ72805.1 essential cell division protein (stabilizes FtsZ ring) [Magnetospira sp. QH-2]
MSTFSRTDTSLFGRWWWTIDRWSLVALATLVACGLVLAMAATPPVAERIGLDPFHFTRRQFLFLPLAFGTVLAVSMLGSRGVRRLALAMLTASMVMLVLTLVIGSEVKGAQRWLSIGGLSIQASEFAKPAFAVLAAWMFAEWRNSGDLPGHWVATGLYLIIAMLLLMQPDVGQTIVLSAIWAVQFFLAGLPLMIVAVLGLLFLGGAVAAYFTFSHVQLRIDRFLDPEAEGYQIARATEAFLKGGLFGRGPGEGRVKEVLPDAHADFVFAVVGEEFGLIVCLLLVALFAFMVLRGFARVLADDDLFKLLAVAGLLTQFGLQALINMASTLSLMPPKGMTLPFLSYGGSSVMALAIGMGMVFALTRKGTGRGGTS